MIVVKSDEVKSAESKDALVKTGPVHRKLLIDADVTKGFGVVLVDFAPGARLYFHTHPFEQIIYVTAGKGILATKTEEKTVTPGTVVFIPAGEVHWHGAIKDSSFQHVALYRGESKKAE